MRDNRSNSPTQDLKQLGIVEKLEEALKAIETNVTPSEHLNTVLSRPLTIQVKDGDRGAEFVNKQTISIGVDFVSASEVSNTRKSIEVSIGKVLFNQPEIRYD